MANQFLQELQKDIFTIYGTPGSEENRILCAALVLQAVFGLLRESTWQVDVKTQTGADEASSSSNDSSSMTRRGGLFVPFPYHLFPKDRQRMAVVMTVSWYDLGHMRKLIEQLFTDLDVTIEEVNVRLLEKERRTLICQTAAHQHDHWVLRVTSHSTGMQWALDITGPQHGIVFPGYLWGAYCELKVQKVLAVKPLGTLARYTAWISQLKCSMGLSFDIRGQVMQAFHEKVDVAMAKKRRTWSDILTKNPAVILKQKMNIFKLGGKAIETFIAGQQLQSRRLKAERYEKRHLDEVVAYREAVYNQFLADDDVDLNIVALL